MESLVVDLAVDSSHGLDPCRLLPHLAVDDLTTNITGVEEGCSYGLFL
jgi:hypothetical protein